MVSLANIVDHCQKQNETFSDFIAETSKELKKETASKPASKAKSDCRFFDSKGYDINLQSCNTAGKTMSLFYMFADGTECLVFKNIKLLKKALGVSHERLCAVLNNLHDYGLIQIKKKSRKEPLQIMLTPLGNELMKDINFSNYIKECFKQPYPTDEERQAFWRQRVVTQQRFASDHP